MLQPRTARADLSGLLRNGFYVVGGGDRAAGSSVAFAAVQLWLAGGAGWHGCGGGGGGAFGGVGGRHVLVLWWAGVLSGARSAVRWWWQWREQLCLSLCWHR